jgi:hypothetical protein
MLLVLVAIQFISWLAPPLYFAKGIIANYAPLHTLLEFIAIIIATSWKPAMIRIALNSVKKSSITVNLELMWLSFG